MKIECSVEKVEATVVGEGVPGETAEVAYSRPLKLVFSEGNENTVVVNIDRQRAGELLELILVAAPDLMVGVRLLDCMEKTP